MANHLTDSWFFDVGLDDVVPPYVTNQVPFAGETILDLTSNIEFDVLDLLSGVDTSTLDVLIDINGSASAAITGGVFQAGFSGTIVPIVNGYRITIDPDTDFNKAQTITVSIDVQDLALIPNVMGTVIYQFFTTFSTPICVLEECRIASLLGSIVQLDARRSSSPDGSPITYEWKFIQVPKDSVFVPDVGAINPVSLKDLRPSTYSAVSFIPDKRGDYVIQLVAKSGGATSDPCTALVQIGLSRALCGSGKVPDAKFTWSFLSNFWSLVEDRQYFETIWSAQLQLIGAELIKLWSNDYNKSLDTIQQSVQRRWQRFDLHTKLEDQVQRVIVGNTKAGLTASTGPLSGSATTTKIMSVLLLDDDLTTIDINYGAKGRLIDINGAAYTIERTYNTSLSSTSTWSSAAWGSAAWSGADVSVAVVDEEAVVSGQTNIPYRIPHMIHVPSYDLEAEGVSKGDTLILEWTRQDSGLTAEMAVRVVAVDRERIGFEFTINPVPDGQSALDYDLFEQLVQDLRIVPPQASDTEIAAAANALIAFVPTGINLSSRPFSTFRITVKASKVIHNSKRKIDDLYVSIPFLQEQLKEDPDVILRENFDYFLEEGYLGFDSSLFSAENPAPEYLWAECAHLDNTPAIEANFGRLVELSPDDLVGKATRAPYLASVKGLWFALTNGPTIANLRLGLHILMGLPFAEARAKILDITNNFSTDTFGKPVGRILAEDVDEEDRGTGIRRFYFFPEDVGLETNPLTLSPYAVGDVIPAFAVLSKGVEVTDYVKDPQWWIRTLYNNEIKKFFLFRAQIDTDSGVFDEKDLVFSLEFIRRIKPVYTDVVANVLRKLDDDVLGGFQDNLNNSKVVQNFYDNVGHYGGHESTVRGNDLNHQGITLWRGDSRPFSTRSAHTLRDVVTAQNGSSVEATSATGFGTVRPRVTGDASTPTVEGDILAIHPSQDGAGVYTPGYYEFTSLAGATGPAVLNLAPTGDPATFALSAPDASLFPYGSDLVASVVRRSANPKVIGSNLGTTAGAIQIAESIGSLFVSNGVQIDDHLIIESGANAGEYRIVSIVAQTSPRDYTPSGVPQISETQVGLVDLDGSNPGLADLTGQDFRVISPALVRTVVQGAKIVQSGGNMFAEVLDPSTSFPFDVFTPGMVGEALVVQNADNPLNNKNYVIQAYVHPGRVQITVGSPETSDALAQAVVTIRSPYHPGLEKAEELAPTEVFSVVVV